MNDRIICRVLTGPTASGKTQLGIRLAKEKGWDILNMDSMQVYRGMEIGTAKPIKEEMQGVRHHLMDILDPCERFSVAEYRDKAEKLIIGLHEEGKEVLFVGGTVLYLQALMHPMGMGYVPPNEILRKRLNAVAETTEGRKELWKRLKAVDGVTADRLPVNDTRRIIRALEVYESTGIPFSAQRPREDESSSRFEWIAVSTRMERALLYERINTRVKEMVRSGLADEVKNLLSQGIPEDAQSMSGLGYKEMIPYINGLCSLEEAVDRIQTGTRHYAKRQMTFLRREESIHYVDTDRGNAYDDLYRLFNLEEKHAKDYTDD